MFDSGLGRFAAESIDIVLTENAENPFIAIILIVSLISMHYKLEIVRKKRKIFSEYRKREAKINSDCYFLVFILCICIVLILLKYLVLI